MSETQGSTQHGELGYMGERMVNLAMQLRLQLSTVRMIDEETDSIVATWWKEDDFAAFSALMDLEEALMSEEADLLVDTSDVSRFHATLPFDDADLEWLLAKRRTMWGLQNTDVALVETGRFSVNDRIRELGRRETVDGDRIVRSWVSWRGDNNTGDYPESATRDRAVEVLDRLVHVILPKQADT